MGAQKLLSPEPGEFSYEYDNFLKSVKTTLMFESWISEVAEQDLTDNFNVYPGDLRNYIYTIDWLIYSFAELAKSVDVKDCIGFANRLRTRISYGIKDELFTLVSLPGIGRVRARRLFNNGITSFQELLNAPFEKVAQLVGPALATKLREK
ncbi:ATP-dependent DNA helicase Hel308 [Candidatus Tiddalikarchaeum anstoanum]|nr:ATP-dependent DNA helicase Hel308 [Candidatus Tiddalikarchaeum anstoanum]